MSTAPAEQTVVRPLHDYQDEAVDAVLSTPGHWLIEHPTGSGKTTEAIALAAELLARRCRVVIATTQRHIEDGFVSRPFTAISRLSGTILPAPPGLCLVARNEADGSVKTLLSYVEDTDPAPYVLTATHAALVRAFPPFATLPESLAHCVLILDEFHHVGAEGLGQLVHAWTAKGGRVVALTATAFRADGDPVLLPGMHVLRRSLAEHIDPSSNGGRAYGPETVESRMVPVPAAPGVTEEEFRGDALPRDAATRDRMVKAVVAAWKADDRPKAVVRVPSLLGGSAAVVVPLISAFTRAGARVLDATGPDPSDSARVQAALTAERALSDYSKSQYDVVIGVARVVEGMDWPLCSDVYCVGLPRSVLLAMQLLGRSTREKKKAFRGYPKSAAGRARVSFFPPVAPGQDLVDYHRRHTVFTVCHLVNPTAAAEWNLIKDLDRGLPVSIIAEGERAAPGEVRRNFPRLDPVVRGRAEAAIAAAREHLLAADSVPSDVRVYERVRDTHPEITAAVLKRVIVETEVESTGEAAGRVRSRLFDAVRAAREAGLAGKSAIERAFETVLLDLDQYAVARSDRFARISATALAVTGASMRELASRVFRERPLTPEWLARVVRAHLDRKKTLPTGRTTGGPACSPEESWADIDEALRERRRGWPAAGARSLHEFAARTGRVRTGRDVLAEFVRAVPPETAEASLLAHLMTTRLRLGKGGKELVPVGEAPASEITRERLLAWAQVISAEAPYPTVPYLQVLVYNLSRWLSRRGGRFKAFVPTVPVGAHTAAGGAVVWVPPPDDRVVRSGTRVVLSLAAGDRFRVDPAAPDGARPGHRADGVTVRSRTEAGYRDAVAPFSVGRSARDRPLSTGPGDRSVTVLLPLSWVISSFDAQGSGSEIPAPRSWPVTVARLPNVELD